MVSMIDKKPDYRISAAIMFAVLMLMSPNAINASPDEGALGDWLSRYVGARSVGLGGAFVAIGDEASAALWNPAAIDRMDQNNVQTESVRLFEDTSMNMFSVAMPNRSLPSFGITLISLSSGGFVLTNELNERIGEFDAGNAAILFTAAKRLTQKFSLGVNAKILKQSIEDYNAAGAGADIGLIYAAHDKVLVGASVLNVSGPSITLRETSESMPVEYRFGASARFLDNTGLVSAELSTRNGYGTEARAGAEMWLLNSLAIRIGYNGENMSTGFGARLPNGLHVDYGYSDHELGNTHRFGISYRFGGFYAKSQAFPEVFSPTGQNPVTKFRLIAKTRTDAVDWQLIIRDQSEMIVRSFGGQGQPPSHVQWDGKNVDSLPLPDGLYRYQLIVHDQAGQEIVGRQYDVEIFTGGPQGSVPVIVD